jgi:hypothetical protein
MQVTIVVLLKTHVIRLPPVVKKNDFVESSGLGVVADGRLVVGIGCSCLSGAVGGGGV